MFSALIFIHELGHFTAARTFGVAVKEFALGMGPKILSRPSKKTGIVYSIRLLPIGGFVSMVGEDEESDDENAFNKKPVWQRIIIITAGAAMNILLGIIIMSVIVFTSKSLGSTTILRFSESPSPSEASGLRTGDTVLKINNTGVHIASDLVYEVMRAGTEPVDVTVSRSGEKLVIPGVIFPTVIEGGIEYGMVDFYVQVSEHTLGNLLKHAYFQSASSVKMIWQSIFDFVTGKYGFDQLSGPVGVTSAIGEAASTGISNLMYLCALITLNLGIFNLLPLPALDGGRLIFLLVELIRGKPIKPEYEGYVHFVGIVLLMILMAVVAYKDIMKLIIK